MCQYFKDKESCLKYSNKLAHNGYRVKHMSQSVNNNQCHSMVNQDNQLDRLKDQYKIRGTLDKQTRGVDQQ